MFASSYFESSRTKLLVFLNSLTYSMKIWQLDRKPSMCVVFEDDPRGITAAHNCTMMAIALIGAHPA